MKVAEAIHNENKTAHGGEPGDQTGDEILVRNWKIRTGGWDYYLEPPTREIGRAAAEYARRIAECSKFGYSQDQDSETGRWSGYKAIKKVGVNNLESAAPSAFDCSSHIISSYIFAGLNHKATGYTGSMLKSFKEAGFKAYNDAEHTASCNKAVIGGVYLTPGKHVLICLEDGEDVEPIPPEEDVKPPYILIKGASVGVNVRTGPSTATKILGVAHNGDKLQYLGDDDETDWHKVIYKKKDVEYVAYLTGSKKHQKYMEIVTE